MDIQQSNKALIARRPVLEPALLKETLCKTNRRSLELMCEISKRLIQREDTNLIGALRTEFTNLSAPQIQQISQLPFLLVTLGFQQPDRWQTLLRHPGSKLGTIQWRQYYPKNAAITLTRSVLSLAWHAAQDAPEFAVIALGIHPKVCRVLTRIELNQLDQIAQHQHANLMPRWEDRPVVWRHLIDAGHAVGNTPNSFILYGLELTAGDLGIRSQ